MNSASWSVSRSRTYARRSNRSPLTRRAELLVEPVKPSTQGHPRERLSDPVARHATPAVVAVAVVRPQRRGQRPRVVLPGEDHVVDLAAVPSDQLAAEALAP